jgi:hypothetical protein
MTPASDRQPIDRSSSQRIGRHVTNYLTVWIPGLVATLALLGASIPAAHAQEAAPEPIIEPESGVEAAEPSVEQEPEVIDESAAAQPVVDPPSRVARLGYVDGEVTVAPAGTEEWAEAVLNRPLTSGDRLWVESGGRAELQIGSAAVYLDGDTGFGFIELDDGVLQASLTEGAATLRVRRLAEGETIQVETPHSTVVLNHVGEYHLEVDKAGDRTIVKTRSGEAQVKGGSETFAVRDNERGVFAGVENLTGRIERLDGRTAFENWANDRDARNERSQSAQYVSRDVIGYEDLDDNGEWISEPEYGHVWRPRHVAHDWAPYRYGRWAYVSPWGWSWIDDARWGFAPSHYGRWAHIRDRWCWVPGPRHLRPVYAPALVGWVGGPRVGVSVSFGSGVGWYPLGPRDIFYPGYRHTPRYVRYVNVSNTIIVNNSYFYGGRHRHPPHFDHRRYPHAVTVVNRDYFVAGRPIGGHRLNLDAANISHWRADTRPPAIAPYRESVLAGQPRSGPRNGGRFGREGDYFSNRVPFHTERRAIETNGGRPIGRAELRDRNRLTNGPKQGGDFRSSRQGAGASGIKRAERERIEGMGFNGRDRDRDRAPRELNNGSVREWQQRNPELSRRVRPEARFSTQPRSGQQHDRNDARERLEIMRADQARQDARQEARRRIHSDRPPANSSQQRERANNLNRPPERARESSRSSSFRYSEPPRQQSQPRAQPRSEPRRNFSPPPKQPRQETRSPSQPRSSNNGGSRGGDRGSRNNGTRPH